MPEVLVSDQDDTIISSSPIFAGLKPQESAAVTGCGEVAQYKGGAVIFEESSQSTDLFLLLDGRVCVEIEAPRSMGKPGERLQLALLREGDVFGEMAFLRGKRRSACVCAMDEVRALRMDGPRLQALFQQDAGLGYRVMRNLAAILAQRVVDVNFKWRQDMGGVPK
jgi:CRP/FNR family transcriptional regulator, cyclic AMP receptor protein